MIHNGLWHVFSSIGFADLLDMTVVAVFIYSIMLWFEWTKAAFVARGILILGALYVLARQLGMVLTTWIFHGFFAVFVVALVVIFQEEIRRFFERLAMWRWRGLKVETLRSEQVEVILQSASHHAREHIGALLVFRGRDPLERHIDGGVDLDGKVSSPLLQSIFDVHSEGHDGAVILENGRIVRFGAHLPLSKNLDRLVGVGTRHAAALGISEVTDALALVISEQRGTLSVAQNGEIRQIADLHELETLLKRFLAPEKPGKKTPLIVDILRRNRGEKLLSVAVSLGLWLIFVQGFKPDSKTFNVDVQVQNTPANMRIKAVSPHAVAISLDGLKRDLDAVHAGQLRVSINAQDAELGTNNFTVVEEGVRVPEHLRFASADPEKVMVEFVKPISKPAPEVVKSSTGTVSVSSSPAVLSTREE